jgi:hypothetical protein
MAIYAFGTFVVPIVMVMRGRIVFGGMTLQAELVSIVF